MTEPPNNFLDVPTLLDRSQPRLRGNWLWLAGGAFLLLVLGSALLSGQSGAMARLVSIFSAMVMLGLIAGMGLMTWFAVRSARTEHMQLQATEELIQLRRWAQAAAVLEQMLLRPTRTPGGRVQALIYLATVLSRYNRFDDAIAVHNHLLETVSLDDGTTHALRLGRAMSMLRVDHLLDADRAINEMRRDLRDAGESADNTASDGIESAGLALVEIYRDVKTGHPAEAIEMFEKKLPILRRQLSHRSADAWALVAKAYDLLGRDSDAQRAYGNATVLSDRLELERRYPEVISLSKKYQPAEVLLAA